MFLHQFDFELPRALIAQQPLNRRTASRLLHLQRTDQSIAHRQFEELPGLLRHNDLLVCNDTRVLPARLLGCKPSGGKVELLLVRQVEGQHNTWHCMSRSSKPLRPGSRLEFPEGITAEVMVPAGNGTYEIRFSAPEPFLNALDKAGHMPLPPYIRRADTAFDKQRYQTVFATNPGAVAAPTAGLHFSQETFAALSARGVAVCHITLHVGPGTFLPVRHDNLAEHRMHAEVYQITAAAADRINRTRAEGGRVIAVGTTVTRTLEHAVDAQGRVLAGQGETDLFIKPGHKFRIVDALVTNFHLPKSTLLVLVAAFAGTDFILQAYHQAVARQYRFFSYGDCMLIE
ncbi:MAG: tRNA preQ1(34) S-adenosylmethionine ribosyltransferase-isomerase QueA [Desulfuromonadales bacterium]|jgi:S-adenosylmethionine:tRNA ribosyltransferase-isomerase